MKQHCAACKKLRVIFQTVEKQGLCRNCYKQFLKDLDFERLLEIMRKTYDVRHKSSL